MIISPNSLVSRKTATATAPTTSAQGVAAAAAQAAQPGGPMGKDQFMKLLIAQMQNQDPTSPMDGSQMAAQLAQFSSLEQLQQINTTLTGQTGAQGTLLGAIQSTAAINSIGHTVVASGNQIEIGGGVPTGSVTADFAQGAATATLHIYDASGNEVGSRKLGAVSGGRNTFDLGAAAKGLGDGKYTYSIDAKTAGGDPVSVTTYMTGKVTGVSSDPKGLVLNLGGLTVPYGNVIQILN